MTARNIIKWVALGFGGVLALAVVVGLVLYLNGRRKAAVRYEVAAQPVPIPTDEAALARGRHLVNVVSHCAACHGTDLGGTPFFESPLLGKVYAANLTAGEGGVGGAYSDEDWVRAIRHGVRPDGSPMLGMPSWNFSHYDDEALGAIIAYIQSMPPVDRPPEPNRLSTVAWMMMGAGMLGEYSVEMIDHTQDFNDAPAPGRNAVYGKHLVTVGGCHDCHGEGLSGGSAAPGEPYAPDLTTAGDLGDWSEDDFFTALRTGVRPGGQQLDGEAMPWQIVGQMTDEELGAIWLYLQSLPAVAEGE